MGDSRRFSLSCALLLLSMIPLPAVEIYLAPLEIVEGGRQPGLEKVLQKRATLRRFQSAVNRLDPAGVIQLRRVQGEPGSNGGAPRTILQAAAFCEERQIELLLYGYLRRTAYTWEGEIKLYDHREHTIDKRFFNRDGAEEFDRFIDDFARTIVAYFSNDLGLAPREVEAPPERNIFALPFAISYPISCSSEWDRTTMGIIGFETGLLFVPRRPLWHLHGDAWELQTGLTVAYSLLSNPPGYESFLLHRLRLNIPALALGRFAGDRRVVVGAGLSLHADCLDQRRAYYGAYRTVSIAPGFFLETGFRYRISSRWSIGLRAPLEFALFDDVQVNLLPGICGVYEFPIHRKDR